MKFLPGFAFKSNHFNADGRGLPVVRIRDVVVGRPSTFYEGDYPKRFMIRDGDYLIGMDGEFNLGRWQGGEALLNQRVCKVDAVSEALHVPYLAAYLPAALKRIEDATPFATVKHLSTKKLEAVEIPLPPIEEQRRIADILDRADALRAKRRETLAHLDDLTQSIFLDMFGDGDSAEGRSTLLSEAFWFQEGPGVRTWQFRDSGIKLLNVANITRGGQLDLSKTSRYLDENEVSRKYSHFLVDAGDLVIASSGVGFDTDGLLRTRGAFVQAGHLPLCMNTSTIRFKPADGQSNLRYLKAWLDGLQFRQQITRLVTGTAQQNFGPSHLKALRMTVPSPDLQHEFAGRIEQVDTVGARARDQLHRLDSLFAVMQRHAFDGLL